MVSPQHWFPVITGENKYYPVPDIHVRQQCVNVLLHDLTLVFHDFFVHFFLLLFLFLRFFLRNTSNSCLPDFFCFGNSLYSSSLRLVNVSAYNRNAGNFIIASPHPQPALFHILSRPLSRHIDSSAGSSHSAPHLPGIRRTSICNDRLFCMSSLHRPLRYPFCPPNARVSSLSKSLVSVFFGIAGTKS